MIDTQKKEEYATFLARKRKSHTASGFEPGALLDALYPFQAHITRWALKLGRAAIFADCGLGKSLMQLEWARHVNQHTSKPVLILAPLAVSKQTQREAARFGIPASVVRCAADVTSGINITNYEMLHAFDCSVFGGVVLDECFPAGTKIETPSGPCYIEDIRVGDRILNAYGVDEVSNVHRRRVQSAVKANIGGRIIVSSPNHPYFTQRGWVGAQDLQPGDCAMETSSAMRLVWGLGCAAHVPGGEEKILQQVLLSEMENVPAGCIGESPQPGGSKEKRTGEKQVVSVGVADRSQGDGEDQETEPNVRSRSAREGIIPLEEHEPQTFRAWWKWQRDDRVAILHGIDTGAGVDCGVCLITGKADSELSNMLQVRLGQSRSEDQHRNGWDLPSQQEITGREKRQNAGVSWVESVEILESGHPDLERYRDADGFIYFYDIGATRHPSFSVDGLLVHNSSILKSFTGAIRNQVIESFARTEYRLACTATPSPNDFMELGNHSEFLGVMDRSGMLATYFNHDGGETSKWRLKGHAVKPFWRDFVSSWAVMISKPSDLGFEDAGYDLLPIRRHFHIIETEAQDGVLFPVEAVSLGERRESRRISIADRVAPVANLANASTDQWIVWGDLNAETNAAAGAVRDSIQVAGPDTQEHKERAFLGFADGTYRNLVTKPRIGGFGMNWQNCHNMAFLGLSDSYEATYQAERRCWRFGQQHPVDVHTFITDRDAAVVRNIERKRKQAEDMTAAMVAAMKDAHD